MYCSYCGVSINSDEVVREQRLGISTDTGNETTVEVGRLVSSVACDGCGARTQRELNYLGSMFQAENGDYVRFDDDEEYG